MWDGGDCRDGAETQMEFLRDDHEELDHWSAAIDDPDGCATNCADGWLADKFCDAVRHAFELQGMCGITNLFAELQHPELWV